MVERSITGEHLIAELDRRPASAALIQQCCGVTTARN